MKLELFESVKKLHELELYDDLLLYVELNLQEHKLADNLKIDEQAFIYMCVADAQYQTSHFTQSAKVLVFLLNTYYNIFTYDLFIFLQY